MAFGLWIEGLEFEIWTILAQILTTLGILTTIVDIVLAHSLRILKIGITKGLILGRVVAHGEGGWD